MIGDKSAIWMAHKLKEYCQGMAYCKRCPFNNGAPFNYCMFVHGHMPANWPIEKEDATDGQTAQD